METHRRGGAGNEPADGYKKGLLPVAGEQQFLKKSGSLDVCEEASEGGSQSTTEGSPP